MKPFIDIKKKILIPVLAVAALLSACSKNPVEAAKPDGKKTASSKSLAQTTAQSVSGFHKNASQAGKIGSLMAGPAAAKPAVGVKAVSGGGRTAAKGAKPTAHTASKTPVKKKSALAKSAAVPTYTDSTRTVLKDSASGWVYDIHTFKETDPQNPYEGSDSTVYKWPVNPKFGLQVKSMHTIHTYPDGTRQVDAILDFDGNGLVNGGLHSMVIKISRTTHMDTAWINMQVSDQGNLVLIDSLGEGRPIKMADSSFIAGKAIYCRMLTDADGDGLLNAATDGKIRVNEETRGVNEDGSVSLQTTLYGAGADHDFLLSDDNEIVFFHSATLNALGDTLSVETGADADEDGFYLNPASAANRVSVTTRSLKGDDYKMYKDSVVKILGKSEESALEKIAFFAAQGEYLDGSKSFSTTHNLNGKDSYGEKDTVELREKVDYTGVPITPKDDNSLLDSIVRVTYLLPDPAKNGDDKLVWWSSKSYFKKGQDRITISETFLPKIPVAANLDADAGISTTETRYSASGDHEVARTYDWNRFDNKSGVSSWRNVSYLGGGDSTWETGSTLAKGIGTYVKALDKNTRNSGWYNSNTNEFKDTTVYLGNKGSEPAMEVSYGTYKDEDGTGDWTTVVIAVNGEKSTSRTVRVLEGKGVFSVMTISGADTSSYKTRGDTTIWVEKSGDTATTYSQVQHDDGSYSVIYNTVETSTLAPLTSGIITYGVDGVGKGSVTTYENRVAKAAVTIEIDADGATFLDGVKVVEDDGGAAVDASPAKG